MENGHYLRIFFSFLGEKKSLLGINYHFRLASVQYVKSTKKILAGDRPPLPFWQCQDFESTCYVNTFLTKEDTWMLVEFAFPFADVDVYILYVYNRICKCGNMESILKSFWPACHNSSANRWVPCFHVLPLNLQRLRKLFFVRPTAQLHAKRPNLRENKCIDQAWNQEHPEMCPPKLLHVPSHGSGRSVFIQRMSSCLPGDKSMAGKSSF